MSEDRSQNTSVVEIRIAWILRALISFTILYHLVHGAWLYSILCFFALVLMLTPPLLAKTNQVNVPLELELLVLWWLVTDMTFGRLGGLYSTSVWYDKAIHFGNSGLLGIAAFLSIYALKMIGRIHTGYFLNVLAIFLMTLGMGAFWEILEYVTDFFFHQGAQGSPLLAPLADTMWDLILDGIGGLLGGVLGAWYMQKSKRSMIRWKKFAELIDGTGSLKKESR
ncbi:MAG: hypothetical protein CL678_06710 [Bdellovibrionaceae bacterium]|nr:hypothetical protein [Pseudobdellovibrionaceae bacterium]|tara:strand:+ start:434 stop:1105 length:672 start_codon:yes stop_codon:yes gene_type:complete